MTDAFFSHRLPRWAEWLAHRCQSLPVGWFGRRVAFLLRKPILWLRRPVVDIAVCGVNFRLYPGTNLSDKRLLATPGMLDGRERAFFAGLLPRQAWLVDVGANIGGFSLLLAGVREDLRVLCVEPDPDMVSRLQANIAFNEMQQRVKVAAVAIAPDVSEVTLFRDSRNRGQNTLLAGQVDAQGDRVSVPAKGLAELLGEASVTGSYALKVDIEGFEQAVLEDLLHTVEPARWPQWVQLEQYRDRPLGPAVELLRRNGFQVCLRTRMNVILERSPVQAGAR